MQYKQKQITAAYSCRYYLHDFSLYAGECAAISGEKLIQIITLFCGNTNILQSAPVQQTITAIQSEVVLYAIYGDIDAITKATSGYGEKRASCRSTRMKYLTYIFRFFVSKFLLKRNSGVWVVVNNFNLLVATTP